MQAFSRWNPMYTLSWCTPVFRGFLPCHPSATGNSFESVREVYVRANYWKKAASLPTTPRFIVDKPSLLPTGKFFNLRSEAEQ